MRIVLPASFKQINLRAGVNVIVGQGVFHAADMAHLAGEIEDVVLTAHKKVDGVLIAHVRDVDGQFIADIGNVVDIAAVVPAPASR